MTLEEQIMKLQTYKMFEGENTVYVERDDVLKLLEQEPKTDTLDKIRAEIDKKQYDFMANKDYDEGIRFGLMLAYQIIDKYMAESEE